MEITESDDDITQTKLREEYIRGLVEMTNLFVARSGMEADLAADALMTGACEILLRRYGAALAAEMLRGAAGVVERENQPH
jgi:hypothetical protein